MSLELYLHGAKIFLSKTVDVAHYIRVIYWFANSKKLYSKQAYEKNSANFKSFEDVNCNGLAYLITGASGGIGREICEYLIEKEGTTIYAVCFNKKKGEELKEKLTSKCKPNSKFEIFYLDLSEIKAVNEFLDSFIKSNKPLNVLIYAAGYYQEKLEHNSYGGEKMFVVNALSSYLFLKRISEYLDRTKVETKKNRIILVSCGVVLTINCRPNDLELKKYPFKPLFNFSHHKKTVVNLCYAFSHQYPSIFYSCANPGWVDTDCVRESNNKACKFRSDIRTPKQGADTILWLAVSEEALNSESGQFYLDRSICKPTYVQTPTFIKNFLEPILLKNIDSILDEHFTKSGATTSSQPDTENRTNDSSAIKDKE